MQKKAHTQTNTEQNKTKQRKERENNVMNIDNSTKKSNFFAKFQCENLVQIHKEKFKDIVCQFQRTKNVNKFWTF